MSSNLKTSEVLDLAADEIEARGWLQASEANAEGFTAWGGGAGSQKPVCLEGGIMAAAGISIGLSDIPPSDFTRCPAYVAVVEYLDMGPNDLVFQWNDEEGRTQQEVIEVLRAAAAVERVKEATASATYDTADQPLPVEIPETSAA